MARDKNPPNVPQARPIERYWFLCKEKYGQRFIPPKNLRGFKQIWLNLSKEIATRHAQSLMKNVRKRLKQIGDKGVYEEFKNKN